MRIIAKLDVKPPYVVKPVHFEGWRKIDTPDKLAKKYYDEGADEIFYIDIVASLFQREILYKEFEQTSSKIFIPLAYGGGIRSIENMSKLFHSGADKVVINSYAVQENPQIIFEASQIFGAQAVVVNIEAKRADNKWKCYSDSGRIPSSYELLKWVETIQENGAGEILIQSVDCDGRNRGFDVDLIKSVVENTSVPVVASSGGWSEIHIEELLSTVSPSGLAFASALHYKNLNISKIRSFISGN